MLDASYCLFIFLAVKWGKRHIKRHLGRPLKKRKKKTLQGESVYTFDSSCSNDIMIGCPRT